MAKETFLIPHDFEDRRFHVGLEKLPYDYSGAKLRDEMLKRTDDLIVILTEKEKDTLVAAPNADFMASDKMKRSVFGAAERLRWVHIASSGADHFFKRGEVSPDDFRARRIMITTSKGAGVMVIAEQVLCYMLMFSRNMIRAVRQHLVGHWQRYTGDELRGRTLGVIGWGAIGSRVGYLAKCLEMHVIGCKRDPARHDGVADKIYPASAYKEIMQQSDYVLLCVPITEETRNLINDQSLGWLKPTAYLMNVARGECIDEAALVHALKSGRIAGYASDNHGHPVGPVTDENMERLSPESELWGMPNVIVTPNCAVAGPRRYEYMAEIIVDNYRAIRDGKEPKTRLIWQGAPV